MTKPSDVVIVGSGPAGYTAAIYTARAGLNPILVEGSVTAGGALMNTTDVENFPGFADGIQGPELMENMRKQASRFGTTFLTDDVVSMNLIGKHKNLVLGNGDTLVSKSVILALGAEHRALGLPREKEFTGKGVSTCATCDGFFFRGKTVTVVGGGDSALEEALFLSKFASYVNLVHRRDEFRASKALLDRALDNEKIEFITPYEVTEIKGDSRLNAVTIQNSLNAETQNLNTDGLFIAIGHDPRTSLLAGQVNLDSGGYVVTYNNSTKTGLMGVFACGDVADPTYRQAITAAGSGCQAALDAQHYLD